MKKILYWLPRILTIIFIAFLSLFALDSFGGNVPILHQIVGFFIHLIPSFALIGILILAWKKPQMGGLIFLGIGCAFTIFFNTYEHLLNFLFISCPVFLIGILFLITQNVKLKTQNKK